MSTIQQLNDRISSLESALSSMGINIKKAIEDDKQSKLRMQNIPQNINGMQIALCVSTQDPLSAGRIRIYHPLFDYEYDPDFSDLGNAPTPDQLPWASPISSLGGFDDSGSTWVPPAGSKVAVIYHNGNIDEPYYLGTIWDRHRGPDRQHLPYQYNYASMQEYNCLWEGRRNGYNFGDNSGDQVNGPWNTDSNQQYNWDDTDTSYASLEERQSQTYPHFYGMKTTGKNWLKFVDGDPTCNYKGRRIELATARGAGLFLKDDHLTPFPQYGYGGNPGLGCTVYPCCESSAPTPLCPSVECGTPQNIPCQFSGLKSSPTLNRSNTPNDPFQGRSEENKYYTGVNTPQRNFVNLPQSGACLISPAGNFVKLDDSVDQPFGVPTWSRDFDFGCNNLYKGNIEIGEATGHFIQLNGEETIPDIRNENNGILISTAYGNYVKLCDETLQVGNTCDCPPNIAGPNRGIQAGTNSGHRFIMSDQGLTACGSQRVYSPVSQLANKKGYEGYCLLRSGYGLTLLMKDSFIQTETEQQFIMVEAPQKTNVARGPHLMIMQEQASGPGFLFLRAGGVMVQTSYDESLEVVGDEANNPSSKFVSVTDSYIVQTKNYYFNHSSLALIWADRYAFIIAGQDCPVPENPKDIINSSNQAIAAVTQPGAQNKQTREPCIYPAIVGKDWWRCPFTNFIHAGILLGPDGKPILDSRSDRVFLSSGPTGSEDSANTT